MNSPSLPSWSFWLMGLGLAGFVLLLVQMIRRNKGIRRSFYAWPYTLWMIISTIVPLILIGYYGFTNSILVIITKQLLSCFSRNSSYMGIFKNIFISIKNRKIYV